MTAIEMKVSAVMVDPVTNMPIVVLKNEAGDRLLPIWVGPFEAQAIAMQREGVAAPRPMTHDLVGLMLKALEARIEKVVISDLKDNTFFAVLHLRNAAGRYAVDSRPSDAIALALRAESPILVEPLVLEKAQGGDEQAKRPEDQEQRIKKWFDTVDPGDFSKYQM